MKNTDLTLCDFSSASDFRRPLNYLCGIVPTACHTTVGVKYYSSVTHTDPKAKEAMLSSCESLQKVIIGHRNRNLVSLWLVERFERRVTCEVGIKPVLTLYQLISKNEQPSKC